MIRLHRGSAPDFWTREQVKKWTKRWLDKGCKSDKWYWPQVGGKKINKHAEEAMALWHHNKCAFCEAPLFSGQDVEHYRSKTKYPLAAYVWRNLFLICRNCNQAKGNGEHLGCLKPDRDNPAKYLWVNPVSLKVAPKPGISDEKRECAEKTIKLYQLDRPELAKLYELYLNLFELKESHADDSKPFSLMVKSLLLR